MRPFRDLPIARKTLTLGLVPAILALVVAILASLLSTYMTARRIQHADVESQATVVADNTGAGLAFGDKSVVDEIVQALRVRPNIDSVCVYDKAGALFSRFERDNFKCPPAWPAATPVAVPVAVTQAMAGNDPVGTVYIRGNYANLFNWMRQQSVVGFLALICGVLVATGLTHYVQRYLSTPIVELATTLDRVAASADYSTRAQVRTGDEVGRLVHSFNTMLGVIQRKDVERNELLLKSQESNRVKDEFLATVSHELRTPLNAMLGWLQIIRTTDMDPATVQRALASIERNAQSQARVVEDLIELSRVVTGKLQLRSKPMDLRAVVDAALDVVRTAAAAKGVTLQSKLPPAAGDHLGRQGSLAAGYMEPAVECSQVHRVRRHGNRGTGRRRTQLLDRGCGHRHRYFGGISAIHLRSLPAGRPVDNTRAWRPWPGTGDRQRDHRIAWRRPESGERWPWPRHPLYPDASKSVDK